MFSIYPPRQILLSNSISNKPWLLPRSPQLILPSSPIKFLQIKPNSIKCKRIITELRAFISVPCLLAFSLTHSRVPSNLTLVFPVFMQEWSRYRRRPRHDPATRHPPRTNGVRGLVPRRQWRVETRSSVPATATDCPATTTVVTGALHHVRDSILQN